MPQASDKQHTYAPLLNQRSKVTIVPPRLVAYFLVEVKLRRVRPMSVDVGRTRDEFDRFRVRLNSGTGRFGRKWPMFVKCAQGLGEYGPNSAGLGLSVAENGPDWTLGRFGQLHSASVVLERNSAT